MAARTWLTALVVLTACATTSSTSAPPGTEAAAKEKYDAAVTSCNSTHSYDESVALSTVQPGSPAAANPTAAADNKWKACLAKAQDTLDSETAALKAPPK